MIIRRKHNANFTVVPNGPINDEALTFEALGLLAYLLSRPDNWQVHLNQLRTRGELGRDRAQKLMRLLIDAGYVVRRQARADDSKQFRDYEYVVYDCPQLQKDEIEPEPENPVTAPPEAKSGVAFVPQPEKPEPGNQVALLRTDSNKSPSERNSAPNGAGGKPPSASAKVWKEGLDLLETLPSKPNRSIIGKWLKRTPSDEGKEKLLALIGGARRAGTADPVGYVTAALNREYPPPADPHGFDMAAWQRNAQAALKTKSWSSAWGPPPGKKGCLMPSELINPQLTQALATRRIAA